MNQNINSTSSYNFGRFNSFVLQPLVSGVPCNSKDMTEQVEMDNEATLEDKLSQRYFPDVWFDTKVEIKTDQSQSVELQVPNELTSWMVYGTAMHPTKGFAVVKKEAKVSVYNEIALKVHTPATVREGEVVNVEFTIFTFRKVADYGQVGVVIENGDLMDEKKTTVNGKVCRNYTRKNTQNEMFQFQLSANSLSKSQSIFVQARSLGKMKITFRATATYGVEDVITRVIDVRRRRPVKDTVVGSYLIDMADNGSLEKTVLMNLPANAELVDAYAMFSGNLLGHVLEDLELFR
jgi:hypothetical protein